MAPKAILLILYIPTIQRVLSPFAFLFIMIQHYFASSAIHLPLEIRQKKVHARILQQRPGTPGHSMPRPQLPDRLSVGITEMEVQEQVLYPRTHTLPPGFI